MFQHCTRRVAGLSPRMMPDKILADLDGALEGKFGAVAIVTDAYERIRIEGPDVKEVLAQIVALDLTSTSFPAGTSARTGFGKASALVHKLRKDAFDIYVDATLTRYAMKLVESCSGSVNSNADYKC